jgi:hypothetical protein
MKPIAIALSGVGRDLKGVGDVWGCPTNVQRKAIQICHNECPLNNECILIKIGK